MSTPLESMELTAAYQVGCGHARTWFVPNSKASRVHTIVAWRAICYADAVIAYEHEPAFVELMTQWEHGFDFATPSSDNQPSETMSAQLTGAIAGRDPRNGGRHVEFKSIDRAPYELSALLRQLPPDFLTSPSVTQDALVIAEQARQHAENATAELMAGLEALGKLMLAAGENDGTDTGNTTLSSLGALPHHIAAEERFFQETAISLAFGCVLHSQRRKQQNGGDHA